MNTIRRNKFSLWRKAKSLFLGNTYRKIAFLYLFLILFCACLLFFCNKSSINILNGHKFSFIDAFYSASSALTDTGLSTTVIGKQYNVFGFLIILFLIQIGGLGFITIKIIIYSLIFRKIAFKDKNFIESEKGLAKSGYSVSMIKVTFITVIILELIGTLVFSFYFTYNKINFPAHIHLYKNYSLSLFYSLFTAVSCVNNAGLDIFGSTKLVQGFTESNSLAFMNYDTFLLLFIAFLTMFGGIGFPLYYELYLFVMTRIKKTNIKHKISFQASFMAYAYIFFTVLAFGILLFTMLTRNDDQLNMEFSKLPTGKKILNIFFVSVSSRNSGFNTINIKALTEASKLMLSIFMWIGASPFSTGGGIRSTTVFLILIAIYCYFVGRKRTSLRKKYIDEDTVKRSFMIAIFSIIIIFFVLFLCILWTNLTNYDVYHFYDYLIDITSSFGTCGLSSGVIPFLPWYLLLFSIFLMVIGQLTLSSTLLLWTSRYNSHSNLYESRGQKLLIG